MRFPKLPLDYFNSIQSSAFKSSVDSQPPQQVSATPIGPELVGPMVGVAVSPVGRHLPIGSSDDRGDVFFVLDESAPSWGMLPRPFLRRGPPTGAGASWWTSQFKFYLTYTIPGTSIMTLSDGNPCHPIFHSLGLWLFIYWEISHRSRSAESAVFSLEWYIPTAVGVLAVGPVSIPTASKYEDKYFTLTKQQRFRVSYVSLQRQAGVTQTDQVRN